MCDAMGMIPSSRCPCCPCCCRQEGRHRRPQRGRDADAPLQLPRLKHARQQPQRPRSLPGETLQREERRLVLSSHCPAPLPCCSLPCLPPIAPPTRPRAPQPASPWPTRPAASTVLPARPPPTSPLRAPQTRASLTRWQQHREPRSLSSSSGCAPTTAPRPRTAPSTRARAGTASTSRCPASRRRSCR